MKCKTTQDNSGLVSNFFLSSVHDIYYSRALQRFPPNWKRWTVEYNITKRTKCVSGSTKYLIFSTSPNSSCARTPPSLEPGHQTSPWPGILCLGWDNTLLQQEHGDIASGLNCTSRTIPRWTMSADSNQLSLL